MAVNTTRLGLLKKDPVVDGNDTFNIKTMLNDNWDALDTNVETITGAQSKADAAKTAAISAAATDATSKANAAEANAKNASIPLSQKDVPGGVASLDGNGKLTASQKGISIKTGAISNGGTIPQTAGYANYMYFVSVNSIPYQELSTGSTRYISTSVNQSTRVVSVSGYPSTGTANYLEIAW